MLEPSDFSAWLSAVVRDAGGLAVAVLPVDARLEPPALRERFNTWMAGENAGLLGYLDRSITTRTALATTQPLAKSLVLALFAGDWARPDAAPTLPPPPTPDAPAGRVSWYACGRDYHAVGRQLLQTVAQALHDRFATDASMEIAVDTKPLPELFLASLAGLGQIGRSGLLRFPQHGSRVFVGSLLTSLELPELRPASPAPFPRCEHCGACARACPTGALHQPDMLRVRLCRSYLSMEHRGPLSRAQARLLGDSLFGCDACTAICPPSLPEPWGVPVDLDWLVRAPAAEVRQVIDGTALAHAGVTLLRRNSAAVLNHLATPAARTLLQHLHQHSHSPVVQETLANIQ